MLNIDALLRARVGHCVAFAEAGAANGENPQFKLDVIWAMLDSIERAFPQ